LLFDSSNKVCLPLFAFLPILTPFTLQDHSFSPSPLCHGSCEGFGGIRMPRCEGNALGEYTHSSSSVRFFSPILPFHSPIDISFLLSHPHTIFPHQSPPFRPSCSPSLPPPISPPTSLVHAIPHNCLGHPRPPPYPSTGLSTSIYSRFHVPMPSCGSHSFILPIPLIPQIRFSPGFP
jgi:hypothetical protein